MRIFQICLVLLICHTAIQAVETNTNPSNAYLAEIRSRQHHEWTGNAALFLGVSDFLEDEWTGSERMETAGLKIDIGKKGWLVNLALDFKTARGEGNNGVNNIEGELTEIDLGVRMYIQEEHLHWGAYIGGGIALIDTELLVNNTSFDASDTGFWINTGIFYRYQETWDFGLDLRYSSVILGFEDSDQINPTHFSYSLSAGYHF